MSEYNLKKVIEETKTLIKKMLKIIIQMNIFIVYGIVLMEVDLKRLKNFQLKN